MKKLCVLMVLLSGLFILLSCEKEDEDDVSERFRMLTTPVWVSESLLVNGVDASGPDGLLSSFTGDVKFNEDGTGSFGEYEGTWEFAKNETELVITTEALPFKLSTQILELTHDALRVTTKFPDLLNPGEELEIEMTFEAK